MNVEGFFQRPYKQTLHELKASLFGQIMQITEDMIYKERWVEAGDKIPEDFFWENFAGNMKAFARLDYSHNYKINPLNIPEEEFKKFFAWVAEESLTLPKINLSSEMYSSLLNAIFTLRAKLGTLPPPSTKHKQQATANMVCFLFLVGLTILFFLMSPLLGLCALGGTFYWCWTRWGQWFNL